MKVAVPCPQLARASAPAVAGLPADLAFCHPDIRGVHSIDSAAVTLEVERDSDDLRAQVAKVVALSISSYRFVSDQAPLWRHDALSRYIDGGRGLARYIAAHVVELGAGQYALTGPAAELRGFLDARFRGLATQVGAEPWHLPSVEPTHDLLRSTGYLASHGQHVSFAYRLPAHFDRLAAFTADARGPDRLAWPSPPHEVEPTGHILAPVVCHNIYRALRGTSLSGGRAITALGTCYRHEGFRFAPLLRQWEFSMREIVLAGPPAYVEEVRIRTLDLVKELATELDLDARLEIATDPFFVSEAASARTFQALRSTKLELRLAIDDVVTTAAGSFNLHGDHFTSPMSIRDRDGNLVETACIAFGLERWMAAILARWGSPPRAPW